MKSLLLASALVFASAFAHASDDTTNFSCKPVAGQPNGLGIESIQLEISNEDPEALMTLVYAAGLQPQISHMATEGDYTRWELIPNSERDGNVSLFIESTKGKWTATVRSEGMDTFSILSCEEK